LFPYEALLYYIFLYVSHFFLAMSIGHSFLFYCR